MGNAEAPGDDRKQLLETWINQYTDALLRVCYVSLRDRAQAEDATQETFLKAWQHMGQFRSKSDVSEKAWLMRIAVNTCRDYHRSKWFRHVDRRKSIDELPQVTAGPEDHALLRDVYELPEKLKQAILLYYYQELTLNETAAALGIGRSAVCKRLKKAQSLLKGRLTGRDFDGE